MGVGQDDELASRAAALLSSLPGIASSPVRMVVELQLQLGYYARCREAHALAFLTGRAASLRQLAHDCAPFKSATAGVTAASAP